MKEIKIKNHDYWGKCPKCDTAIGYNNVVMKHTGILSMFVAYCCPECDSILRLDI